jgi:hypothetical protein
VNIYHLRLQRLSRRNPVCLVPLLSVRLCCVIPRLCGWLLGGEKKAKRELFALRHECMNGEMEVANKLRTVKQAS